MKVNFSDYAKRLLAGELIHNFSEDYTQEDIHDADKTGDEVTAESLAKHAKNCEDAAACAAKCGNAELARRLEDEAKELTKESDKILNQMINTETKEFATASEIPSTLAHEGKRIWDNTKLKFKDIWDNSAAKASYEAALEANKAREEHANAEEAKTKELSDQANKYAEEMNNSSKATAVEQAHDSHKGGAEGVGAYLDLKYNQADKWTKDKLGLSAGATAGIGAAGAAGLYGLYKLYKTLKNKKNKTPLEVQLMNDAKSQYLAKKANFSKSK